MTSAQHQQTRFQLIPSAALDEMVRLVSLCAETHEGRILIGIAGGPGTGKSSLAEQLVVHLNAKKPANAMQVPMDGFHMRQAKLEQLGLADIKGAPETFEPEEFISLLTALKSAESEVSAPGYSRQIEDTMPDIYAIPLDVQIVVIEGNYLLLPDPPWRGIADLLDLSIYIEVPREIVRERLLKRHAEHGLFTPERNRLHVDNVDMANFETVAASAIRADVRIDIDTAH